jgi:O-antigen/teichoic acid export membrane protein
MSLVSSVRWVAVSQIARVASQLMSTAVLARLLPPSSYGLMAIAMTVTNLAYMVRDLGTTTAIIQCKELSDELKCTVYWMNVALALIIALVLAVVALPIASAFNEQSLSAMIMVLALVFPILSLSLVQQVLMERASQFRMLARIEAVSSFGGLALAIMLAVNGAGIWSLVFQMIFAAILTTVQVLLASGWKPRRVFDKHDLSAILGFSAHFSLFRLLNYLEQNVDSMIIGKVLGAAVLGIYAMAVKVMLFPLQNLTAVATRALFPAMCRNQESPAVLGTLYLRSLGVICIVTAPMMAGVFFLREPFVTILFGPKWVDMADILKWLAPVGFLQSITNSTGVVFLAKGASRLLLGLGILGAVFLVSASVVGVRWGIEGVAACYFVANLINLFPCFFLAIRLLRISPLSAALKVARPIIASCLMLLTLNMTNSAIATLTIPLIASFLLKIIIGAAAYLFALLVILRQDISDIRALVKFG